MKERKIEIPALLSDLRSDIVEAPRVIRQASGIMLFEIGRAHV